MKTIIDSLKYGFILSCFLVILVGIGVAYKIIIPLFFQSFVLCLGVLCILYLTVGYFTDHYGESEDEYQKRIEEDKYKNRKIY